jgi:DNA polymerase delta subunit 1
MPAATLAPQKRVLGDSTKANRNIAPLSPNSAKKRKLDSDSPAATLRSSQNVPKSKLGSSQPKSQFESEVLEKLTQDINGLKRANAERDQQWDRPSLNEFDPKKDSLCFQQIEAEEGTLHGGKTTIKLFGVTEVPQRVSHFPDNY